MMPLTKTEKTFRYHILSAADLVTTERDKRGVAAALALQKERLSVPFVEQARALKFAVAIARLSDDLLKMKHLQSAMLTAAGISDQAIALLRPQDRITIISEFVRNHLEPTGENFKETLVEQFLSARYHTLRRKMRNIAGVVAQQRLSRAVIATLAISGREYQWLHVAERGWKLKPEDEAGIEVNVRALSWRTRSAARTLLYNLKIPRVGKNVDLCLLSVEPQALDARSIRSTINRTDVYLALGELKGGIDPAGADEHWKTARTALERIRKKFEKIGNRPSLFFVGAAIESDMAEEMWSNLRSGLLTNAANLTKDDQLTSVAQWLCNL